MSRWVRLYLEKPVFLLLACLLPCTFTLLWFYSNTELPSSDATDYLAPAWKTYHHFKTTSWPDNILHFQIIRGWRPIFFSVLGLPFIFFSQGDVYFTYHAVAFLCLLISITYGYLLLRLELDSASAIVGANLIGLLPFVQSPVITFFSESALLPCVFAALYHLLCSNFFRQKKHTLAFIVSFALAIMIRPVEAITSMAFICMFYLGLGLYKQIFSLRQLMLVAAIMFSALFLCCFMTVTHFLDHYPFQMIDNAQYDHQFVQSLYHLLMQTFIFALLSWALIISIDYFIPSRYRVRWQGGAESPAIVVVFASITLLTLLWFTPEMFKTILWIYRTSVGDLAIITAATHPPLPLWSALKNFVQSEGIIVSSVLCIAAILGLACSNKLQSVKHVFFTNYLLIIIHPFFYLGSFKYDSNLNT